MAQLTARILLQISPNAHMAADRPRSQAAPKTRTKNNSDSKRITMTTYRVVIIGIKSGKDPDEVVQRLAAMFKQPVERLRALVSASHTVVKRGADIALAAKMQAAIEDAGCNVVVEPEIPDSTTVNSPSKSILANEVRQPPLVSADKLGSAKQSNFEPQEPSITSPDPKPVPILGVFLFFVFVTPLVMFSLNWLREASGISSSPIPHFLLVMWIVAVVITTLLGTTATKRERSNRNLRTAALSFCAIFILIAFPFAFDWIPTNIGQPNVAMPHTPPSALARTTVLGTSTRQTANSFQDAGGLTADPSWNGLYVTNVVWSYNNPNSTLSSVMLVVRGKAEWLAISKQWSPDTLSTQDLRKVLSTVCGVPSSAWTFAREDRSFGSVKSDTIVCGYGTRSDGYYEVHIMLPQ